MVSLPVCLIESLDMLARWRPKIPPATLNQFEPAFVTVKNVLSVCGAVAVSNVLLNFNYLAVKKTYIIILFFLAVCIGVVASQLGNVSSYSHFEDERLKEGNEVRLKGTLSMNHPVVYEPMIDPNSFAFYLLDENGVECKVVCFDEKPVDFEKSDEIVLTGSMKEDVFYANDLLVKCPSKYVEEEIEKKEI